MDDEPVSSSAIVPPRSSFFTRTAASTKRAFSSLSHRDFRYLVGSSLSLGFGQWFQTIGLGWLVLEVTGSALQLAAVNSIRGVVALVAAPIGGVLADRFSRRQVAVWSTGLACLQALALSYLVLAHRVEVWHIYLFAAAEGIASGIYMPARQALVFNVVPRQDLPNAIAMNSVAQNLARVSGPALAGIVIGFAGTATAFVMLGATKLLAVALTLPIRTVVAQSVSKEGVSPWASLIGGLRYARTNRTIVALLVAATIPPMLVFPYFQMLPLFVKEVLHQGATGYGLLATAGGWGNLLGLGWLIFAGDVRRKGLLVLTTLFLYIFFIGLFTQSDSFTLCMIWLGLSGVSFAIAQTLINTLFQVLTPDEYRGRVLSLYSMSNGLQPLGALPMGFAVAAWGPATGILVFMVIAGAVTCAVAAFAPALRRT